ncbi:MAG: hypothetical protein LBU27_05455 [Candidatus Peribacteria bacterium]|jgi:single-stranded-DNA-specific exonuclease|nr:hypothetical protein [Candidatus Peribacteria bacterium]
MQAYCSEKIREEDLEKLMVIDTQIFPHERTPENFALIEKFSPFGEGNDEPLFLFQNIEVHRVEKVGKNGNGHLKIYAQWGDQLIHVLFRGKGNQCDLLPSQLSVIGKIKRDTFNGGWYVDGEEIVE